jgi:hypothetical protein
VEYLLGEVCNLENRDISRSHPLWVSQSVFYQLFEVYVKAFVNLRVIEIVMFITVNLLGITI